MPSILTSEKKVLQGEIGKLPAQTICCTGNKHQQATQQCQDQAACHACGRWRCAMYWLSAVILAVYSEEAAFRWMSRVVTMPPRKVQMHMPQKRLMVVIQQSLAVTGPCWP